ncbi:MAG: hypothetical protein HGA42_00455, partial [Nostocales cyanobacterium W4_Combined_metabat2_030]|nr:hypothetical protein [Nostocales cyanobacterium W4_Combined_metabat2_030]
MERPYLNLELRRLVAQRADNLCEYCLIAEHDTILGCAIDHIIRFIRRKCDGLHRE